MDPLGGHERGAVISCFCRAGRRLPARRWLCPGERIADTPTNRPRCPDLVGRKLRGQLVLEVPKQKAPVPTAILDDTAKRGIRIKEASDFAGFPVGPPVTQIVEIPELLSR